MMNRIATSGTRFVDDTGRERIFNGLNIVYKGIEAGKDGIIRYPDGITDTTADILAQRGINIIRLGLTWAGVEPEMRRYNTVYLDGVKTVLKRLEARGIYAFLDFHQDLYSYHCFESGGDGAPLWACTGKGKQGKSLFIWAEGYFINRKVQTSFDNFWNNKPVNGKGLQDYFCDMLRFTVGYLADCGNIMGYDVLNEPFPGTPGGKIFRTLVINGVETLLLSRRVNRKKLIADALSGRVMDMLSVADDKTVYHGVIDAAQPYVKEFDTGRYYPFLKRCAKAIRSQTPDGIIFTENSYYSNLGIPCLCPVITDDDGNKEKNTAFAPHGYDITVDTPLTNEASPCRVDFIFDEHKRRQDILNIPVLVGEWGGMVEGGEKYPALEHLVDKFDRNKWSSTYWHYRDSFTEEDSEIMHILSRPYPQAVAGEIKRYGYLRDRKEFFLSYTGNADIKTPTVIYLPQAPKKIYATEDYTLKPFGKAYILEVKPGNRASVVKVEF